MEIKKIYLEKNILDFFFIEFSILKTFTYEIPIP